MIIYHLNMNSTGERVGTLMGAFQNGFTAKHVRVSPILEQDHQQQSPRTKSISREKTMNVRVSRRLSAENAKTLRLLCDQVKKRCEDEFDESQKSTSRICFEGLFQETAVKLVQAIMNDEINNEIRSIINQMACKITYDAHVHGVNYTEYARLQNIIEIASNIEDKIQELLKEKGLDEFRFNIPDLIELLVAAIKQNIIGQFFRETIATNIKLMVRGTLKELNYQVSIRDAFDIAKHINVIGLGRLLTFKKASASSDIDIKMIADDTATGMLPILVSLNIEPELFLEALKKNSFKMLLIEKQKLGQNQLSLELKEFTFTYMTQIIQYITKRR